MAGLEFLRCCSRVAAPIWLAAVVAAGTAVTRSATADSPAGTRITDVSVEHQDGETSVIAVGFDGPISSHRWSHIDGERPRAVLRIAGIVEAYRPYEVAVEDGRVHRIRIGHHPEFDPPEEHLVFDLVDDRVAITRVTRQDRRLIVVLQRTEASGEPQHPAPTQPAPTAPAPTTVPATPTPTTTPTATVTPTPTARLAPTATATPVPATPRISVSPTPTPASPVPPGQPQAMPPATPTNPPRETAPEPRVADVPHHPEDSSGPLLTELVISHREDGSALVRVTTDGPIEGSDIRFFGVRVGPPRNLLVIPGAGLPGENALLQVRDGLLCEIGVAFRQDDGPARTELIFYLASPEVKFEQAAVKGVHAVIHLRPPADAHTPLGCEIESRTRIRTWRFPATGPPQESTIGAGSGVP